MHETFGVPAGKALLQVFDNVRVTQTYQWSAILSADRSMVQPALVAFNASLHMMPLALKAAWCEFVRDIAAQEGTEKIHRYRAFHDNGDRGATASVTAPTLVNASSKTSAIDAMTSMLRMSDVVVTSLCNLLGKGVGAGLPPHFMRRTMEEVRHRCWPCMDARKCLCGHPALCVFMDAHLYDVTFSLPKVMRPNAVADMVRQQWWSKEDLAERAERVARECAAEFL
jgi:hypothetical protein